ncbi:unnamed protein product [Orchesella dallaii]|uniref:Uncharacterized protein n=1 Tax=Orchesella dallaii TaxID=48710 RepID=A0ABP1QY00_9HEXA
MYSDNSSSQLSSSPTSQLAFELEEVFEEEPRIISCVLLFTFFYILALIVLFFGLTYLIIEVNEFAATLSEIKHTFAYLKETYPLLLQKDTGAQFRDAVSGL